MEVTYKQYQEDLNNFIKKHNSYDLAIKTSNLTNGSYTKLYMYEDGGVLWEVNDMEYTEKAEIELHGVKMFTDVHLIKHEYWTTDDSTTKVWYESR